MTLDLETVKRIAFLSRLKVDDSQAEAVRDDLNSILGFIDQLNEVDTQGVDPMIGVGAEEMPMREDLVNDGGYVDRVLANSPETAANMFVVPKVVE
jgi:aspartyl-tRNA(Asn)/glutamyl-tRNA(Gln) amidotransferase subunit C